jgi:hypothetical protein
LAYGAKVKRRVGVSVRTLLDSFDELSAADQHKVAVEILRRTAQFSIDELPEESLIAAADAIFRELDEREAEDADPSPR